MVQLRLVIAAIVACFTVAVQGATMTGDGGNWPPIKSSSMLSPSSIAVLKNGCHSNAPLEATAVAAEDDDKKKRECGARCQKQFDGCYDICKAAQDKDKRKDCQEGCQNRYRECKMACE